MPALRETPSKNKTPIQRNTCPKCGHVVHEGCRVTVLGQLPPRYRVISIDCLVCKIVF